MYFTRLARLGTREKRLGEDAQASWSCGCAGIPVDIDKADAVGHIEGMVAAAGKCALHEGEPDRERGLPTAESERLVVVEPDPHNRKKLRCETDEPRVAQIVTRPGLARGVNAEARRAYRRAPRGRS